MPEANSIGYHLAQAKVLTLVALSQISNKVDAYLSAGQSVFWDGRGSADVMLAYRWMAAKSQRSGGYRNSLYRHMSRVFGAIRCDRLMHILETFLNDSELCMNHFLLADTTLDSRLAKGSCAVFYTTIGTPQKDSLSPVLLIVHLRRRSLMLSIYDK